MSARTDAELTQAGYPTQSTMKSMLNANILFYWSYYSSEDYMFTSRFVAQDIIDETDTEFIFTVTEHEQGNTGTLRTHSVHVPTTYFTDEENWQPFTLNSVAEQLNCK